MVKMVLSLVVYIIFFCYKEYIIHFFLLYYFACRSFYIIVKIQAKARYFEVIARTKKKRKK